MSPRLMVVLSKKKSELQVLKVSEFTEARQKGCKFVEWAPMFAYTLFQTRDFNVKQTHARERTYTQLHIHRHI